jgi:autotransporter family porin
MSGGTIDGNLVTGFGNDTIILSDGSIGGNISVSGGTDSVTITGGELYGSALLSVGSDTFRWENGGIVHGGVDLCPTMTLRPFAILWKAISVHSPRSTAIREPTY